MYGYRDHCMRSAYPSAPEVYCPYSMYRIQCPYYLYRQKVEEYPAHFHKRPTNPPPSNIPNEPAPANTADAATLTSCAYKYTYMWLRNGQSFWTYIVSVGRRSVSGWRYVRGRWRQFGARFEEISNFTCT